jgi:hypothetical protein
MISRKVKKEMLQMIEDPLSFFLKKCHTFWSEAKYRGNIFMLTIFLLTMSNIFMTFAWYGHLKYRNSQLFLAIVASWGIAFFEYCLQVPANRMGSYQFSVVQLKTIQEIITLIVFCFFSYYYLNESVKANHIIGFIFLVLAAFFIFKA